MVEVCAAYEFVDGAALLFDDTLILSANGDERSVHGRIWLHLLQDPHLVAEVLETDAGSRMWNGSDPQISIPSGAMLEPPPIRAFETGVGLEVHPETVRAGDMSASATLLIQLVTPAKLRLPKTGFAGQEQLEFALGTWNILLADVSGTTGEPLARYALIATPSGPITSDTVNELRRQLFLLMSVVCSVECGTGPVLGLDAAGSVLAAEWGAPRTRAKTRPRWCPSYMDPNAIELLASGLTALADDPPLERIVDRAINYLLASCGDEVLEVRIPVACSGLELLSWAILRREGWVDQDTFSKLSVKVSAGAELRLLLKWAGIDVEIPVHFTALRGRAKALGPSWGGPEVVFNVRNALVHPPKRLDDPEWPEDRELVEAWLLSTWYLELLVLRLLGYDREYRSRLQILNEDGSWRDDLVPWAVASGVG